MGIAPEEQMRRRQDVQAALTNAHLEGLEPDPIFFEYAERYVRGEMSLPEALADYLARLRGTIRATRTQ